MLAVALPLAFAAGWLAGFVPQSLESNAGAEGKLQAQRSVDAGDDGAPGKDPTTDGVTRTNDGLTSFVTSCGKVLDIVPTSARSKGNALNVALEIHPVCPEGEWIDAKLMRISLHDEGGAVLAAGNVDAAGAERRVFVPGFTSPASRVNVDFRRGAGWVSPDWLDQEISAGSVVVGCHVPEGTSGRPADEDELDQDLERSLAAAPLPVGRETRDTALAALRRQARLDDYAVSLLEGSWVPQLSSKTAGTFDALDQHRYSLADIYQQFLDLRLKYPNVRLLYSTDWSSYTLDGFWVVIAGVPYVGPDEPNRWCDERGIATSQCFAKQLIRDGAPEGTTKHRRG